MGESISVILPLHRWHRHVEPSIHSVLRQTFEDFECIVVINGNDQTLDSKIPMIESLDQRIKILRVDRENLAAALNHGIDHARHELIARMDGDDLSHPNRFELQMQHMQKHPELAGCGTGASFIDEDSHVREVIMPPTTREQAMWKLMIWNPFVHGSMMLRKTHVLDVGGYNEDLDRAQDFDLWCRLSSAGLGGVSQVLYTHRLHSSERCTRDHTAKASLSEAQSRVTANCLQRAWDSLSNTKTAGVADVMSRIAMGQAQGRIELERMMERHGPTHELLRAWMWSCAVAPLPPTDTPRRLKRLHAGAKMLESMRVDRVWIWGAGDFGRFILGHRSLLGVEIAGVLDDHRHGQRLGEFVIRAPQTLNKNEADEDAIVIASDLYEDQVWNQSETMRQQGIRIVRLPDEQLATPADPSPVSFGTV